MLYHGVPFIPFFVLYFCFSLFFSLSQVLFLEEKEGGARLLHDFQSKLLCKNHFLGRLGKVGSGTPLGLFFFLFSCLFFHFFFIFVFFFNFFQCFSFYFLCFPFFPSLFLCFPLVSFCFPFFVKVSFLLHFVSLFSFLGCSKSVVALRDSLRKVQILSWLYLLCIGSSSLFPVEKCTFL